MTAECEISRLQIWSLESPFPILKGHCIKAHQILKDDPGMFAKRAQGNPRKLVKYCKES